MSSKPLPRNRRKSRRPHGMLSLTAWRGLARNRTVYWGLTIVFGVGIVAMFAGSPGLKGSGRTQDDNSGKVIFTVNGDRIQRKDFEDLWQSESRAQRTSEQDSAGPQGQILQALISLSVLRAEAKAHGIKVTDSDVDKGIEAFREQQGSKSHPLSEDDLLKVTGKQTMDEVREQYRNSILPPLPPLLPTVLGAALSGSGRLTDSDLAASYDQVKLRHILIGVTGSPNPLKNPLPDAQAKRRADEVAAKARAGGDFAALANEYTSDPSNSTPSYSGGKAQTKPKGGDLGWYTRGGGFDPAFEAVAFSLAPGQIGGPVKTPFGYHIIKVEQARRTLPPNYEQDKVKLLAELRNRKSGDAIRMLLAKDEPKAKIVWKDPDFEWKYVYSKVGESAMYQMPGSPVSPEQTHLLDLLRAAVKRNTSDASAAFALGKMLYGQYMSAGISLAVSKRNPSAGAKLPDRDALRAETIAAYETALTHGEDREVRFDLARLYQDAKQDDKALKHYEEILKQLKWDDSSTAKSAYERLQTAFRQLNKPDDLAQATARFNELDAKDKKAAAEKAAQAAKDAADKKARDIEAKLWMEKHAKEKAAQNAGKPGAPAPAPSGVLAPTATAPAPTGH